MEGWCRRELFSLRRVIAGLNIAASKGERKHE